MLPTPSTTHVDYDLIYEPSEDSFLLLDVLSTETPFLSLRLSATPSPLIVEIGTGSGVVLAFTTAHAGHIFERRDVLTLGVDINHFACAATAKTVHGAVAAHGAATRDGQHALFLDAVQGDLGSALRDGEVDVLIFNPPYVPAPLPDLDAHRAFSAAQGGTGTGAGDGSGSGTCSFEQQSRLLELAYAGGVDGMEVTERLLADFPRVLSGRGVAYVLLCRQNRPEEVMERVRAWEGEWRAEIVGASGKVAGWEKLVVLRILREERP